MKIVASVLERTAALCFFAMICAPSAHALNLPEIKKCAVADTEIHKIKSTRNFKELVIAHKSAIASAIHFFRTQVCIAKMKACNAIFNAYKIRAPAMILHALCRTSAKTILMTYWM